MIAARRYGVVPVASGRRSGSQAEPVATSVSFLTCRAMVQSCLQISRQRVGRGLEHPRSSSERSHRSRELGYLTGSGRGSLVGSACRGSGFSPAKINDLYPAKDPAVAQRLYLAHLNCT